MIIKFKTVDTLTYHLRPPRTVLEDWITSNAALFAASPPLISTSTIPVGRHAVNSDPSHQLRCKVMRCDVMRCDEM